MDPYKNKMSESSKKSAFGKKEGIREGGERKEQGVRRSREKSLRTKQNLENLTERRPPVTRFELICVAVGVILYLLLMIMKAAGAGMDPGVKRLVRASHGSGAINYEVMVRGLGDEAASVTIPVRERQYTDEEAHTLFENILRSLPEQILADNRSIDGVRSDLRLVTVLEPYGFTASWSSDHPDIIDPFGGVHNKDLAEKGVEVCLTVTVSDGIHEQSHKLRVMVLPPALTDSQKKEKTFLQLLDRLDQQQQTGEALILPERYEGRTLSYHLEDDGPDITLVPFLGVFLAALLYARDQSAIQEKKKNRDRQMLLDYSEVVAKLMVFIGAGMTVRLAWERVVSGYEQALEKGKRKPRPVYEEMARTVYQIQSGTPEGQAYDRFGRRCGLQPYIKLGALLNQNRKNGSKNLRQVLEAEMGSALEDRKNLAKKLGEEASTKLLLPLFMMLGVVMVMIVVPAFLAFY